MKKQYLSPTTLVVSLTHCSNILAGSPGIITSESAADKNGTVLSRRGGSFWDDDDDE